MNLNRRGFFMQAAALSSAAVLQGRSPRTIDAPPVEVNLAAPGAERYVGRSATDLFVRLEELNPGDPGDLSGAVLRIGDSGECVGLSAEIGDTLQPGGYRKSHLLGLMHAEAVRTLAALDPKSGGREFAVFFSDPEGPECSYSACVVLSPGDAPELRLNVAQHCFGVLRGAPLLKFFDCLSRRAATRDSEAV